MHATAPGAAPRTLRLLASASLALLTLLPGCELRDRFVCGVPAPSGDGASICDGANEACICATHRCARADDGCASRLRYVFEDQGRRDCVEPADAPTVLVQLGAPTEAQYCAGEHGLPPPCGVSKDGQALTCTGPDVCLCSAKRCARVAARCDSGFAWSFGGACVPAPLDVPAELPDRYTNLCADQQPPPVYPEVCGRPRPDGTPETCPTNQVCVCATNQCAEPYPLDPCTSRLRFVRSRTCVPDAQALPEGLTTGFCPGWQLPAIPAAGGLIP